MPKLFRFFLIFLLIITLPSCVLTGQLNESELNIQKNSVFYINILGDDVGVFKGLSSAINNYGYSYDLVKDTDQIPKLQTTLSTGTGFFVSPNIIVTNAHVISDDNAISYFKDGIEFKAKLLYKNTQNDIAILETSNKSEKYFSFAKDEDVKIANSIYALGFPITDILGSEIRVTNGIINSLSGIEGDTNHLQISAQIQPGNSGGPVINEDYKVVGVATSSLSDLYLVNKKGTVPQDINFAVKGQLARLFAKDYMTYDSGSFVQSMSDAINATVLIKNGGSDILNEKQYYVEYSYNAYWDVFHYTLSYLIISCYDVETGKKVSVIQDSFLSLSGAETIAESLMEKVLEDINIYQSSHK